MSTPEVEVIDPRADLSGAYLQATVRIAAALAIHRPCHQPYPWRTPDDACERFHYDGTEAADCIGCGSDSYEDPHPYPCPTALALGVSATEPTLETSP